MKEGNCPCWLVGCAASSPADLLGCPYASQSRQGSRVHTPITYPLTLASLDPGGSASHRVRASIIEPCRRAGSVSTSQKSLLAERERRRERRERAVRDSPGGRGKTEASQPARSPQPTGRRRFLPHREILCAARLARAPFRSVPPNPPSAPAKSLSRAAKSISRAPNRSLTR